MAFKNWIFGILMLDLAFICFMVWRSKMKKCKDCDGKGYYEDRASLIRFRCKGCA